MHLNPHLDGINGSRDISAAGICYFFAKTLHQDNIDTSPLALVGATGDIQEHTGFTGLNRDILKDALDIHALEVKEGARLFGLYTKPLANVLEYTTNPYIPGVTGNYQGALNFLISKHILSPSQARTAFFTDLSTESLNNFQEALTPYTDTDFYGSTYLLTSEQGPTKDVREYSALLNACARTGKPGIAIGVCLRDHHNKQQATFILRDYTKEIISALTWFYTNRSTSSVIEKKGYTIINADNTIRDTIIGTIISLISKSKLYPDSTVILGMSDTLSGDIKISARVSGFEDTTINLSAAMNTLAATLGGHGGGHALAAGATIPQDRKDEILPALTHLLERITIEEQITP